ncbi:MAG: FHA domain-containing protein [Chloroflexi bacterium]|nr:FHA domain-containing protein [Chloroflexota bacterium]MCC6892925.1 FHA domain-containing protein [Anaerolineae bacterium]
MTTQLRPLTSCSQCGQENVEGFAKCMKCGHAPSAAATATNPQAAQNVVYSVTFRVEGEELPLTMVPGQRAMMGRQAPFMLQLPDVDLTELSAAEHGISRVHAVIDCTRTGLHVTDLDSRNGTFVNGEKVHPYNAHILRHGDTIRLGSLTLEVTVKAERSAPAEPAPAPASRSIPAELQPKVTRLLTLAAQVNGSLLSPVPTQIGPNMSPTIKPAS